MHACMHPLIHPFIHPLINLCMHTCMHACIHPSIQEEMVDFSSDTYGVITQFQTTSQNIKYNRIPNYHTSCYKILLIIRINILFSTHDPDINTQLTNLSFELFSAFTSHACVRVWQFSFQKLQKLFGFSFFSTCCLIKFYYLEEIPSFFSFFSKMYCR